MAYKHMDKKITLKKIDDVYWWEDAPCLNFRPTLNILISSGLLKDFSTFDKNCNISLDVEWNGNHEKTICLPGNQYRPLFSTRCL